MALVRAAAWAASERGRLTNDLDTYSALLPQFEHDIQRQSVGA
jgi:hypothetical protein